MQRGAKTSSKATGIGRACLAPTQQDRGTLMLYYKVNAYRHKDGFMSYVRIYMDTDAVMTQVATSTAQTLEEAMAAAMQTVEELKQEFSIEPLLTSWK